MRREEVLKTLITGVFVLLGMGMVSNFIVDPLSYNFVLTASLVSIALWFKLISKVFIQFIATDGRERINQYALLYHLV